MKTKLKQGISTAFKILLAVGLIYWLIQKDVLNWKDLGAFLTPKWVSLGLGLLGINLVLVVSRWRILMRARGLTISFVEIFKLQLIGLFFNFALPGGVGGDLVKGYYVVQDHPNRRLDAGISVMVDRILGLYSMMGITLVTVFFHWSFISKSDALMSLSVATGFAFLIGTVGIILGTSTRVRRSVFINKTLDKLPGGKVLHSVYDGFHAYRNHLGALVKAIVLSAMSQVVAVLLFITVGYALGYSLAEDVYFFAVPLGMIASALPIAPAGIGVGQVAMMAIFKMYAPEANNVGAIGITVMQVGFFVWGLLGAVFYLRRGRVSAANS